MAKWQNDDMLDAALDYIIDNATIQTVCSQQPTTYDEAITTYMLADVAIDSGDFTKANGDVSGRKVTIAAQSDITIDNTGTGNHIAIADSAAGGTLLIVTTCTAISLTATELVDFPAWDDEILDIA